MCKMYRRNMSKYNAFSSVQGSVVGNAGWGMMSIYGKMCSLSVDSPNVNVQVLILIVQKSSGG